MVEILKAAAALSAMLLLGMAMVLGAQALCDRFLD